MSATLRVRSHYNCETLMQEPLPYDPNWRHAIIGCRVVSLLQDMYQFNITYESIRQEGNITDEELKNLSFSDVDNAVDLYMSPMALQSAMLDNAYPLGVIYMWRLGFLLQRMETRTFSQFYSKPFSRPAWNGLYLMAVLVTLILYMVKWWEKRHLGGWECSLINEMLMVIGAYCQHIPPLDAIAASRRMAYFIFFMYAYVVYTFYTSNLLSHLVNDKDHTIDLQALATSDYNCVIVDNIKIALEGSIQRSSESTSVILKKLLILESVTVEAGLEAVKRGKTAVLSDFFTLYPYIMQVFDNSDICMLIEIDLFSKINKYLFTSKEFPYKEQFKIGILRARETGILRRLVTTNLISTPNCEPFPDVQAKLVQISVPLTVLGVTHLVCLFILICEKLHYKKNRVWPYVE